MSVTTRPRAEGNISKLAAVRREETEMSVAPPTSTPVVEVSTRPRGNPAETTRMTSNDIQVGGGL
jgi:hypothetical protein